MVHHVVYSEQASAFSTNALQLLVNENICSKLVDTLLSSWRYPVQLMPHAGEQSGIFAFFQVRVQR